MAALSSAELGLAEQERLLDLARESIAQGLTSGQPPRYSAGEFTGLLARPAASFVTLRLDAALRGCVGSLEARRPLARDVGIAAFNAAFRDIRFPRLTASELGLIRIEISVLSPMVPLDVRDQDELLLRLRPLIDGLLLEDGPARATFLPKVWEQLRAPIDFVTALKRKAGLPADYWSPTLRLCRYQTQCFDERRPVEAVASGR